MELINENIELELEVQSLESMLQKLIDQIVVVEDSLTLTWQAYPEGTPEREWGVPELKCTISILNLMELKRLAEDYKQHVKRKSNADSN